MVLDLPDLHKKHKQCGGIYVIQSSEMKEHNTYKVGMTATSIYGRLDNYHTALPYGFDICALLLMRNKTKTEKDYIRQCERFVHSLLTPELLQTRIFKTRVEVMRDDLGKIMEVMMKAQAKYTCIGMFTDMQEKITFDDKLYEIEKVLGERTDELERVQYEVKWKGHEATTWEFVTALKGRDDKGDWVVSAFKKYENSKKTRRKK